MEIELAYSPAREDRQAVKSGMRTYELSVLPGLAVAGIGVLAVSFAWNIAALFIAVGLTIMGVGQALCVLGPGWRGT
ncbi:MAG: hypothetical protein MI806_20995 [Minwuiales bacterium]|nr:hypothetical protein [Minwuiales bacterium]